MKKEKVQNTKQKWGTDEMLIKTEERKCAKKVHKYNNIDKEVCRMYHKEKKDG